MAPTIRHALRGRRARLIAAVVLVYALLLPIYGPLLSPVFIELLPNHAHVQLSGHGPFHLHSYEVDGEGGDDVFAVPPANDSSFAPGMAAPAAFAALLLLASAPMLMRVAGHRPTRLVGFLPIDDTPPPRTALLLG